MKVTTDQTTSHFWIRQCFKSGIRALSDHSPSPREQNFCQGTITSTDLAAGLKLMLWYTQYQYSSFKIIFMFIHRQISGSLNPFFGKKKKNWCGLQTDDIVYYEIFFPSMAQKYFNTSQYSISTFKMIIRIHKIT